MRRDEMGWGEGKLGVFGVFLISVVQSFIGVLVGVFVFFGGCNRSGHGWMEGWRGFGIKYIISLF